MDDCQELGEQKQEMSNDPNEGAVRISAIFNLVSGGHSSH
jgi:hypothetical protein